MATWRLLLLLFVWVWALPLRATPPILLSPGMYAQDEDSLFIVWPTRSDQPYAPGQHALTALDRATGVPRWHLDARCDPPAPPFLLDGLLFVNDALGSARHPRTGDVVWSGTPTGAKSRGRAMFILPLDHLVLTASGQALDVATGAPRWALGASVYRNVLADGAGRPYTVSNVAFDPATGQLAVLHTTRATPPHTTELRLYETATGTLGRTLPLPGGPLWPADEPTFRAGLVTFTSQAGRHTVDTRTGTLTTVPRSADPAATLPAFANFNRDEYVRTTWPGRSQRQFYYTSLENLLCLDPATIPPTLIWRQPTTVLRPEYRGPPLVLSDHAQATLAVYADGTVLSLDPATGLPRASARIAPLPTLSDPPHAAAAAPAPARSWLRLPLAFLIAPALLLVILLVLRVLFPRPAVRR